MANESHRAAAMINAENRIRFAQFFCALPRVIGSFFKRYSPPRDLVGIRCYVPPNPYPSHLQTQGHNVLILMDYLVRLIAYAHYFRLHGKLSLHRSCFRQRFGLPKNIIRKLARAKRRPYHVRLSSEKHLCPSLRC
jgi:hypothetical protein